MKKLIECVPNFSEGRNDYIIEKIAEVIRRSEGVKLLHVDQGRDANRTVFTFAGEPSAVVEAAFRAIKEATLLIDMRVHQGEHPRFGACDVCPLVPVSNVTMEETVHWARELARRTGEELGIPVYCYEYAAFSENRRSLAHCREGEYEGLRNKLQSPGWKPDFGPERWDERVAITGATAIGARNFLVAFNVNLNTTSVRRANAVAFDIREAGRIFREGDPVTGKIVTDENGEPVRVPGALKHVRAIGWFIREYGIAQVSMNLTNLEVTPLHAAFDEVCTSAQKRGMRVTGSELVGLVPLCSILEAGRHYLRLQKRSAGVPDRELIRIAVKSLGLDDLAPFDPSRRIIEYLLEDDKPRRLSSTPLREFVEETASDSPAPGGGSAAALAGSLGAALGTMVANLSSHKRGWDHRWEEFSAWAEKGMHYANDLLRCVDDDSDAFSGLMQAYSLPKQAGGEPDLRTQAVREATIRAMQVPLRVMRLACGSMEVILAMARTGNPNSVSDAGVGALCARAAVRGAWLNVRINASGIQGCDNIQEMLSEAADLAEKAQRLEEEILEQVNEKIT